VIRTRDPGLGIPDPGSGSGIRQNTKGAKTTRLYQP
jgi:hypothetical protein